MIVIEGPDNSGKTTLGLQLAKKLNLTFVKPRPCTDRDRLRFEVFSWGGKFILDRHNMISEAVYGPILRGQPDLVDSEIWIKGVNFLQQTQSIIIQCVADPHRGFDSNDHLHGVGDNLDDIIRAYDRIMRCLVDERLPVFRYDWTTGTGVETLSYAIEQHYINLGIQIHEHS